MFGLEGAFLPLPTPVPTFIPVTIGVDAPFPPSRSTPRRRMRWTIYVFSNATVQPTFNPVTDINPATTRVNGVSFPERRAHRGRAGLQQRRHPGRHRDHHARGPRSGSRPRPPP